MDYYVQFIKPCEISRDINFFYNKIKEIICNDIFGEYLLDNRKKIHKTYELYDFLSFFENTKLKFKNDKISVEFLVNDLNLSDLNLITFKNVGLFHDYRICNVDMIIRINLSEVEYSNKMIYDNNPFFVNLRKQISGFHNTFMKEFNKKEESKFKYINKKLLKLKKSHYENWNKFILYLTDVTDPDFKKKLYEFKKILNGVITERISTNFALIHNTNFYLKNCHLRQIKTTKFLNGLQRLYLDEEEILYLTKEISKCFNHNIKNYDECFDFIINILEHFNFIYHTKEKNIDFFVANNWNSLLFFLSNDL